MSDKFEREIEEILAKLDDELPAPDPASARPPISLQQKRQQKAKAQRVRTSRPNPLANLSPTTLLFAGAGIMFGGLIVSGFWGPAIWASLAGIVPAVYPDIAPRLVPAATLTVLAHVEFSAAKGQISADHPVLDGLPAPDA